jgi:hypothetical protein
MTEEWLPVLGYENSYMVSRTGTCASIRTKGGSPRWRLLKAAPNHLGYVRYGLCRDNKRCDVFAHRIAWEAFNGKIPDDLQINHRNGIKHDNRLDNLEVVTPSENTLHGFRVLGRKPSINPSKGSKNGRAKLTEKDIPKIRKMLKSNMSQTEISRIYGVNQTQISLIALKKSWRHVR